MVKKKPTESESTRIKKNLHNRKTNPLKTEDEYVHFELKE